MLVVAVGFRQGSGQAAALACEPATEPLGVSARWPLRARMLVHGVMCDVGDRTRPTGWGSPRATSRKACGELCDRFGACGWIGRLRLDGELPFVRRRNQCGSSTADREGRLCDEHGLQVPSRGLPVPEPQPDRSLGQRRRGPGLHPLQRLQSLACSTKACAFRAIAPCV